MMYKIDEKIIDKIINIPFEQPNKDKESTIYLEYTYDKDGEYYRFVFSEYYIDNIYHGNILDSFSKYFNLINNNTDKTTTHYLNSFLNDICLSSKILNDDFTFVNNKKIVENFLTTYKSYILFHPFFLHYFELIYDYCTLILKCNTLVKQNDNMDSIIAIESSIINKIKNAIMVYDSMTEYINHVFIYPYKNSFPISPNLIMSYYENTCFTTKNQLSIYNNSVRDLLETIAPDKITDYTSSIDTMLIKLLSLFYAKSDYESSKSDIKIDFLSEFGIYNDYSFTYQFVAGINYLLNNQVILRKCDNCKQYFLTKYYSTPLFCKRIYKDTGKTCFEISYNKSFQEKMKKNPIYSEYRRVYLKLRTRIKRGTISADDAHIDILISYKDEYMELYKRVSDDKKEDIVKDFIEITKMFN